MNARTWVPLGLALVLGLAAALVARQVLLSRQASVVENPADQLKTVVVANDNILPGTEIDPATLVTAKVSVEMAREDTFATPGELAGRVAQAPIYKGQPLLGKLLAPKGSPSGLAGLVPAGMRAITLEVNEFSGVGGFLTPGCRVDVLATVRGEKDSEMVSQTVVQNVMVTAIGQRMTVQREGKDEGPFRSVTLIASPEEAQAIELAAVLARPRLVLRNQRDDSKDAGPGVTLSDIRGSTRNKLPDDPFANVTAPTPVEPAPTPTPSTQPAVATATDPSEPAYWTIKVIRGGTPSDVVVPVPVKHRSKTRVTPTTPVQPTADVFGEPITGAEASETGR